MAKAIELNRTLETDDGIFNVKWWLDRDIAKEQPCGWTVLGGSKICGKPARYWCVECGLIICKGHRKNHQSSQQHLRRDPKLKLIPRHVEI